MMVAESFVKVFINITYKLILCLTGTLDRLDGKEVLLNKYAPVCDVITLKEAIENGWVADFKQYKVFIDVDLSEYNLVNSMFMHHFSFFNHDFNLAMECATNIQARLDYRDVVGATMKEVTAHAMAWLKNMQARTSFIYNHLKKIEVTNKILLSRTDKKVITFTKRVAHAKLLCRGEVYHGAMNPKKKVEIMEEFNRVGEGVLNSCQALNVGADVQGVNTIIIISGDSSSITKKQRIGRSIRKEGEKVSEVWQLVLRGTAEEGWYRKSSKDLTHITIDEEQLDQLLATGKYQPTKQETLIFKF